MTEFIAWHGIDQAEHTNRGIDTRQNGRMYQVQTYTSYSSVAGEATKLFQKAYEGFLTEGLHLSVEE